MASLLCLFEIILLYFFFLQTVESACAGPVVSKRVVGGVELNPHSFPWQVAIYHDRDFQCGGTLISEEWVLTAAHCVFFFKYPLDKEDFLVVLGDHDRDKDEVTEQKFNVSQIIYHSKYNVPGTFNNDIALMKLSGIAKQNQYVQAACLSMKDDFKDHTFCVLSGWGRPERFLPNSKVLRGAYLQVVPNDLCNRTNMEATRVEVTANMLCAGDPKRPQSGCHGDSGGPFMCLSSTFQWTLHGVMSWGPVSCNTSVAYSVFARVSGYRSWIKTMSGV